MPGGPASLRRWCRLRVKGIPLPSHGKARLPRGNDDRRGVWWRALRGAPSRGSRRASRPAREQQIGQTAGTGAERRDRSDRGGFVRRDRTAQPSGRREEARHQGPSTRPRQSRGGREHPRIGRHRPGRLQVRVLSCVGCGCGGRRPSVLQSQLCRSGRTPHAHRESDLRPVRLQPNHRPTSSAGDEDPAHRAVRRRRFGSRLHGRPGGAGHNHGMGRRGT